MKNVETTLEVQSYAKYGSIEILKIKYIYYILVWSEIIFVKLSGFLCHTWFCI